jgi:hypothetical protein
VSVLQEDSYAVQYPDSFLVLDNADIDSMLAQIYEERGLTLRDMTFKNARDMFEIRKTKDEPDYYLDMLTLSLDELKEKYDNAVAVKDILFYGYPTKRRLMIVGELMEKTWTAYSTVWATGVTGRNLQDLLGRSKIILNVHAFLEDCRQEQVRIFYPVINGCCVVSEKSPHNEFGKSIVVCNTDKIAPTLKHVLDHELWKTVGESAPEVYKKHCEERVKR